MTPLTAFGTLLRRVRARFTRDAEDRDLAEELAWHRDQLERDLIARGMTRADAHHAANRQIGNTTRVREEAHDMWQFGSLDTWLQDVRFGARALKRSPGFTVLAALILAIGIGGTTAIFSAVNTLLIRPLPFADPERLMSVTLTTPAVSGRPPRTDMVWSWPKYVAFRDAQTSYTGLAVYSADAMVATVDDAERETGENVSAAYFRVLGVRPALGRDFTDDLDARPSPGNVALISDDLWQRRFNADSGVLGRSMRIDRVPYEIIGVLPRGFNGITGRAHVWTPVLARQPFVVEQAQSHQFSMVARLRDSVAPERALAEVKMLGARIGAQFVDEVAGAEFGATATLLEATRVDPRVKRSFLILLGAVLLVLCIACANIAHLHLARASARRRELGIRLAIGAGRGRLVRQLLVESVMLAALGGMGGVAIAWWGTTLLSAVNPAQALGAQRLTGLGAVNLTSVRLDASALALIAALVLVTGVLYGILPALSATRKAPSASLRDVSAKVHRSSRLGWFTGRNTLVVGEIALAIVLLAASGLMMRSLANRWGLDVGFDATRVLTARVTMPPSDAPRDSFPRMYDQVLERLRALPGVTHAALISCAPLSGGCNGTAITFHDRPPVEFRQRPLVGVHWVTADFLSVLGVPLLQGEGLAERGRAGQQRAVLVNATAARRFWPGENPIGKPIGVGQGGFDTAYVAGVVGDVRFGTIDSLPRPDVFIPFHQSPRAGVMIVLKSTGDPLALTPAVRATLRELIPGSPTFDVRTLESRAADATAHARFSATVLGIFAGVALLLAALGIYGVMSFVVARRTREIGIRVALGATRGGVMRLVVGYGMALAAVGGVIGLVGARLATRTLESLLFEVTPGDMRTYVLIVAVFAAATVAASLLPARRALGIAPTEALKSD